MADLPLRVKVQGARRYFGSRLLVMITNNDRRVTFLAFDRPQRCVVRAITDSRALWVVTLVSCDPRGAHMKSWCSPLRRWVLASWPGNLRPTTSQSSFVKPPPSGRLPTGISRYCSWATEIYGWWKRRCDDANRILEGFVDVLVSMWCLLLPFFWKSRRLHFWSQQLDYKFTSECQLLSLSTCDHFKPQLWRKWWNCIIWAPPIKDYWWLGDCILYNSTTICMRLMIPISTQGPRVNCLTENINLVQNCRKISH